MSRPVVCDVCNATCQNQNYFELAAWWGKGHCFRGTKRKPDRWLVDSIKTISGWRGDVCQSCWKQHFSSIPLQQDETREAGMRKAKEQNPQLSPLALAMRFGRSTVQEVSCDFCKQQCLEKHLQIRSAWVEQNEFILEAQVCESCVSSQIAPVVQLESTPAVSSIASSVSSN